jgi:rhodanese-related sulfurtransferase
MIQEISCEEYRQLRDMATDHVLIDVREQNDWDAGHIEGAVHVPLGELEARIAEVVPDKKTLVIMHCQRGGRGAKACDKLEQMGYENVKNIKGGYEQFCLTR